VTTDGEAIAEAAAPLKPSLADPEVVKRVRFSVKNQRDCGAASAVGAATVAISLLIGGGQVTLDAFYVLLYAQTLLIVAAGFFAMRAAGMMDRSAGHLSATIGAASTVIAVASTYLASQLRHHGSNSGSTAWWLLLALAGFGALLGLIIRRSAESLLDELDDESWKLRVAPLVDKQQEAIKEMSGMGVLVQAAYQASLKPKAPGS
jgi:Kef-type K+ transport system membrane component KefB